MGRLAHLGHELLRAWATTTLPESGWCCSTPPSPVATKAPSRSCVADVAKVVAGTESPALVAMHHQTTRFSFPTYLPPGIPGPEARHFLRALGRRTPARWSRPATPTATVARRTGPVDGHRGRLAEGLPGHLGGLRGLRGRGGPDRAPHRTSPTPCAGPTTRGGRRAACGVVGAGPARRAAASRSPGDRRTRRPVGQRSWAVANSSMPSSKPTAASEAQTAPPPVPVTRRRGARRRGDSRRPPAAARRAERRGTARRHVQHGVRLAAATLNGPRHVGSGGRARATLARATSRTCTKSRRLAAVLEHLRRLAALERRPEDARHAGVGRVPRHPRAVHVVVAQRRRPTPSCSRAKAAHRCSWCSLVAA